MDRQRAQAFMQKVVGDAGTTLAAGLVYVGDRVGLFAAMAGGEPVLPAPLAERTGLATRYVEEWLAAMVCAGYVEYDPGQGTFRLPEEHAAFLADPGVEQFLGGLFAGLPVLMGMLPRLADAFAHGDGIAFREFGAGLPLALEAMNRPVYENRLVQKWLPTMPDLVERLAGGGSAIDLGCGTGVVPVLLARAFPTAEVTGLDIDARSIAIARNYAQEAGVADRVNFVVSPIDAYRPARQFDFVSTFDLVHDLPDPAGALARVRAMLADGGIYLMVEPRVDDRLENNRDNPFGRLLYAISCLHCVPQSLAQGGPGLGACWGPSRAHALAAQAGFTRFEELPIRSPAQAFYAIRA